MILLLERKCGKFISYNWIVVAKHGDGKNFVYTSFVDRCNVMY